jgi:hypothetical protein
MLSLFKVDI